MTTENKAAYGDLVRFRSELPEHVLEAALRIRALELSAPTDEADCACCRTIENGDMVDKAGICEHYERLDKAYGSIHEIEQALTGEERGVLGEDSRLRGLAWSAELRGRIEATEALGGDPNEGTYPLWYALPEGYYAVPDPRAGAEEITYWYRGEKGRKRKRPVFEPWPARSRYVPVLTSWDEVPYAKGTDEARWYLRAWYEIMVDPYRAAIVEAIVADPAAAARRFAKWAVRCCVCGRKLTHETSKVVGIGPECGKGVPEEVLANRFRPKVGELHAAHLARS